MRPKEYLFISILNRLIRLGKPFHDLFGYTYLILNSGF